MKCHHGVFFVAGLLVAFAYDDLSHNKLATQSHTWIGTMHDASNAVDGNTASCMRTDIIGINSPDKTVWWKVDLGGVYNIYSVNIMFKNYDVYEARQRGRFAGFSLFVSNTGDIQSASLCYKDGPHLPPLNFTCNCTESGRYVIYYNERFDEVTYPSGYEVRVVSTELCEVTVQECNNGTYGFDCVNNCSGHCVNNSPCNKQTGHCDGGCQPGYIDSDCSKKCRSGYFGLDCKEHCNNNCKTKQQCNHVSGECPGGCQDGYMEVYCNRSCEAGRYGENCSRKCSPDCNRTCSHIDGACGDCKDSLESHCSTAVPSDLSSKNMQVTVGVIFGTCVVITVGVVIFFIILRLNRKANTLKKRESIILEAKPTIKPRQIMENKPQHYTENDDANATYALPEKTKRGPPTNKNISVRNIMAQISNMSTKQNAGFKSEYHDIPRGELHPCTEAKKPENKPKNRYTTIFPYDHSRIILKSSAADGSGYINANYIEDTRGKRHYIATQGPKPKTIADFWTMIWQEEVFNIVCLTNLTEGSKNKCAQYWPDIKDKLQGGTLTIRHLEEKTYAEYIIRRFKIHNRATRTDRHVTMFHYITWSDHGVADPLSLVVFHRHVMRATANSAGKYTVVHCSAGVGRTGTYIALDALYREGERTGKINVPMYVRTMRKDRMNMIQGDDQYKLLYLALKESFYGQKKCLNTEKFLGDYQEQTCYGNCGDKAQKNSYSSDLEELLSLRKEYSQQDFITGRAQIYANYTESVLPVEEFMCHLYYMKGYNTYYNAVLIQSFLEKESLISAQYPLPDTTEDFLRLVKDFDARVVVFLCQLEDIESTSKWFPKENQH